MADETTVLTPAAATPTPAAGAAPVVSGDPKADPKGTATPPADPAAAKPDGSSPDPTKAPSPKPTEGQDPKLTAPTPITMADLKPAEGITIDPVIGEKFLQAVQDPALSAKDRAQKLVDLQSEVAQKAVTDAAAQWDSMKDGWKTETFKELGADADKQLAFAATFISKFGDDELKQLITDTGVGSHRALVRCLVKAGKAMSEDTFTEGKGKGSGAEGKTAAQILYPEPVTK